MATSMPGGAIAVNMLGALLLAAGIAGLVVPGVAQNVPALADPATAWSLIGTGLALDFWSALSIVKRLRNR